MNQKITILSLTAGPSGGTKLNNAINFPLKANVTRINSSKQKVTPGSCGMMVTLLKDGEAANG